MPKSKKTFVVKLSSIVTGIDQATEKLESLRPKISAGEQKKLKKQIGRLCKAKELVMLACGRKMTSKLTGPGA
jgi:hypothetical protein